MLASEHITFQGVAMLAHRTLVRLELQVVALDVLRQTIPPLKDPVADAALVLPLRRMCDDMLTQTVDRTKRFLAQITSEILDGRNFLFAAGRHLRLRFGFPRPALELVAAVEAPVGKRNGLAVATLKALQATIVSQGQRLADVAHMLAQSQPGEE